MNRHLSIFYRSLFICLVFVIVACAIPKRSDRHREGNEDFERETFGESTSFRSSSIAVPVATEAEVAMDLTLPTDEERDRLRRRRFEARREEWLDQKRRHLSRSTRYEAPRDSDRSALSTTARDYGFQDDDRGRSQEYNGHSRGVASTAGRGFEPAAPGQMWYRVRNGDTLMKISYKAYGDPLRWREIFQDNREKIKHPALLAKGVQVLLRTSKFAIILKDGVPYFIERNDTLSKISKKVYGDFSKWRRIWHNNPRLIKDPNRIYAGFTLYYPEL